MLLTSISHNEYLPIEKAIVDIDNAKFRVRLRYAALSRIYNYLFELFLNILEAVI
jgi:hypothetical protein